MTRYGRPWSAARLPGRRTHLSGIRNHASPVSPSAWICSCSPRGGQPSQSSGAQGTCSARAGRRGEQGSCMPAPCQATWEPQIMAATAPPPRAAFAPAPLPPLTMRPAAEIHYRCGTSGSQHVPAAGRCRRSGADVCCCWCVFGLRLKSCSRICKTQKPVIKSILKNVNMWSGLLCSVYTGASIFPSPGPRHIEGEKKPLFCFFLCTSARMRVWYCGIHFKVSLCWFLIG